MYKYRVLFIKYKVLPITQNSKVKMQNCNEKLRGNIVALRNSKVKIKRSKSIGIFDSGFGGLSIMKGIVKELPEYDYIYLGDTARVPYGTRSREVIGDFTKQAVDFLFQKNCQLIILACNTASSDALRLIQKEYLPKLYSNKKVLGVLIPAAEVAAEKTKNNKVGVMATAGTVSSGSFSRELKKIDSQIKVFQQACPLLVPIVESGEQNSEVADIILKKYLKPLLAKKIDTLILGCTHYGILENKIKKIVGKNVRLVSESKIIAEKLRYYLSLHPEIEKQVGKNKKREFYSTDITDNFRVLGSRFFGEKIEVKKAKLA